MNRNSASHYPGSPVTQPQEKYKQWLEAGKILALSEQEKSRIEWMIYFEKEAKENVNKTCSHFGISRKTFYKWYKRFTDNKQDVKSLKNISKRPHMVRSCEVSLDQEKRIIQLKKKYMHYGKEKLKILYKKKYSEGISCWKIENIIRKHKLYHNRAVQREIATKTFRLEEETIKKSFTILEKEKNVRFLFHLGTIVMYWNNKKRYVFTAVDHESKLGYARMYKTKNHKVLNDFIFRINHLIRQSIQDIRIDSSQLEPFLNTIINNSGKNNYFSWVKRPKQNINSATFNKTIEYEWLFEKNIDPNCHRFNQDLAHWIIEYNFNRPHQSLNYLTPVEYIKKKSIKDHFKKKMLPEDIVKKVVEYILILDIDELENLSVEKIAKDLSITQTKLWRCFKREKNLTLKEYISRIRITEAALLLQEKSELTVKDIAEKTGFYSYKYFLRIFKKYFGITPGKYRELKKVRGRYPKSK